MEKINNNGAYICSHGIEFKKSDLITIAGYKSGLPINNLGNDVLAHLKTCSDLEVTQKIGKYCRKNAIGQEFNSYDTVF